VHRGDYDALASKVAQFFQRQGIETRLVAGRASKAARRAQVAVGPPPEGGVGVITVALVIAIIAAGLVFVFVGR
jgi:hypothetical protein